MGRSISEYAGFLHWHHRFDEAAEQFAAAVAILQHRLASGSADIADLRQRIGCNELMRGNFARAKKESDESARVFALLQSKFGPGDLRSSLALLGRAAAASGDRETYERSCRQFLDTISDPADLELKRGVAYHCIWLPQSLADMAQPVVLAKDAIGKVGPYPASARTIHAAALYRAGQYKEALAEFNTNTAEQPAGLDFIAQVFLAMTHHHLGNKQEAQRRLGEAEQWMAARLDRKAKEVAASSQKADSTADGQPPQSPMPPRPPPLVEWDETVLNEMMLNEAQALIGETE